MMRSITAVKKEEKKMKKIVYMLKVSTVFSTMISVSLVLAR
jgi:hypothetical protein